MDQALIRVILGINADPEIYVLLERARGRELDACLRERSPAAAGATGITGGGTVFAASARLAIESVIKNGRMSFIRKFTYYGNSRRRGKGHMRRAAYKYAWLGFSLALATPASAAPAPQELRIQLDNAPATLNPRMALDAAGQRLDDFLFRALIQLNSDLNPEPDLAASWKVEDHGLTWRFRMQKDARDQSGAPIGASQMAACLENFRVGKPTSPYAADFPLWKTTESQGDDVLLRLTKPDSYLPAQLGAAALFSDRTRR